MILLLLLAAGAALYYSKSRVSSLVEAALGIEAAAEAASDRGGGSGSDHRVDRCRARGRRADGSAASRSRIPQGSVPIIALEADEIRVAMELASLLEDTVIIRAVAVEKPLVTYELAREGSNLEVIRRNVASFAGSDGEPRSAALARKILVEDLYVRDATDRDERRLSRGKVVDGAPSGHPPREHLRRRGRNRRRRLHRGDHRRDREQHPGSRRSGPRACERGRGPNRRSRLEGRRGRQAGAREGLRIRPGDPGERLGVGAGDPEEEGRNGARDPREGEPSRPARSWSKGTDTARKTLDRLLGKRSD